MTSGHLLSDAHVPAYVTSNYTPLITCGQPLWRQHFTVNK